MRHSGNRDNIFRIFRPHSDLIFGIEISIRRCRAFAPPQQPQWSGRGTMPNNRFALSILVAAMGVAHPELAAAAQPAAAAPAPIRLTAAAEAREKATQQMAGRPDAAEAVLEATSQRDLGGRLDYALFLYAFRSGNARRANDVAGAFSSLMEQLAKIRQPAIGDACTGVKYDGSDASVVAILRCFATANYSTPVLSATGGYLYSAPYSIPCPILVARPALLEATEPYFGSSADLYVPTSGCAEERDRPPDFPQAQIDRFKQASTEADGHFLENYGGTNVRALGRIQTAAVQRLVVSPRELLNQPGSALDFPYQVWGMTGIIPHRTAERLRGIYQQALDALVRYNRRRGLNANEATRAAKTGLFSVVWGADCGRAKPKESTRAMLLEKAPVERIIARLSLPDEGEAPEVVACGRQAPLDPLIHVAVADPAALAAMLDRGYSVATTNGFGKTPLMVAAQVNELQSAQILVARGAAVNATTHGMLTEDARTALMYAAANGSLPMIQLLLNAGADPHQTDTKGKRAIDYLEGSGPTPQNPVLSPADRATAARLLF